MKINSIRLALEFGSLNDVKKYFKDSEINEQIDKKLGGQGKLHLAVKSKNLDIIKFIINKGVNVNQQDDRGNTALHYLTSIRAFNLTKNDLQIAEILLEFGIDINLQDIYGNPPIWSAVFNCATKRGTNFDLVKLLLKYKPNLDIKNNVGKNVKDIIALYNIDELKSLFNNQ